MEVEMLHERQLLRSYFSVWEARLRHEKFDGTLSPVIRRVGVAIGDSAGCLLYKPASGNVVLVRQFRYSTLDHDGGWSTEIVAGVVEPGETPEDTIWREVPEETGYAVERLIPVTRVYTSPGYSDERVSVFIAEIGEDLTTAGGGVPSEDEDILRVEMHATEALKKVASGEIRDAKTVIALLALLTQVLEPMLAKK